MKIVVKVGSAVLTGSNSNFPVNKKVLHNIVSQVAELQKAGHAVIIVTSGAVASCPRNYSKSLRAAVGQPRLIKLYSDNFNLHNIESCQLLFTYADLKGERKQYTSRLILEALNKKVVPIINANDGVNSEELDALGKYADNDVLASQIALMIKAELLFILLKEPGLVDFKNKKVVNVVSSFDEATKLILGKSKSGTGGMMSKIKVAKFLKGKGIETRLIPGRIKNSIVRSIRNEVIGTKFE